MANIITIINNHKKLLKVNVQKLWFYLKKFVYHSVQTVSHSKLMTMFAKETMILCS